MRRAITSVAIALVVAVSLTGCLPPGVQSPLDQLPAGPYDDTAIGELTQQIGSMPGAASARHSQADYGTSDVPVVVGLTVDVALGATADQQAAITEAALAGLAAEDFADTATTFELWSGELPAVLFADYTGTPANGGAIVGYVAQITIMSGAQLRTDVTDHGSHVTAAEPIGDASRAILAVYPDIAALSYPTPGLWEWAIPGITGSGLPSTELASLLGVLGAPIPLAGDDFTYDAPIVVGVGRRSGATSFIVRVDDAFTRWAQITEVVRGALDSGAPDSITVASRSGQPATLTLTSCAKSLIVNETDTAYATRLRESGVVLPENAAPGLCLR